MEDSEDQANEPTEVAGVVDVSDRDEGGDVGDVEVSGHGRPGGVVAGMEFSEGESDACGDEGGEEDDPEGANGFSKGDLGWPGWDGDSCEEPTGEEAHPPSGEKTDLGDEDSGRESEVRMVELKELELGEVFLAQCAGDLIVSDAVDPGDHGTNARCFEHGAEITKSDFGNEESGENHGKGAGELGRLTLLLGVTPVASPSFSEGINKFPILAATFVGEMCGGVDLEFAPGEKGDFVGFFFERVDPENVEERLVVGDALSVGLSPNALGRMAASPGTDFELFVLLDDFDAGDSARVWIDVLPLADEARKGIGTRIGVEERSDDQGEEGCEGDERMFFHSEGVFIKTFADPRCVLHRFYTPWYRIRVRSGFRESRGHWGGLEDRQGFG